MVDVLNRLLSSIAMCNDQLDCAEDRYDLDAFNKWYAERERLYRERDNVFAFLGGI